MPIRPGHNERRIAASRAESAVRSEAVSSEDLEPSDDEPGRADHHIERFEGSLLAGRQPRDLLHQEFKVGLGRSEIDVPGITSWLD